jgi:hypothetical protein
MDRSMTHPTEATPKWLIPWCTYTLAVLVGSLAAGRDEVQITTLFLGIPISWIITRCKPGARTWALWTASIVLGVAAGWLAV